MKEDPLYISSEPIDSSSKSIAAISAKYVPYIHTILAYSAFLIALFIGCVTHYEKIVQNEYYGYPQEYIPSVSATTGDRYPARAYFQILIALTSGPRFLLVYLWYVYTTKTIRTSTTSFGKGLLIVGLIRTISCGGWTYITSTDDHDLHDLAMGLYLVCTLPWQLGVLSTSSRQLPHLLKWRRLLVTAFFGTTPFMIYYFIQHKVHHVPGAYSMYAIFEWSLILYDVGFDAISMMDFQSLDLVIIDKSPFICKKEIV
ncbi:Frag1/DRAM/Sfk1 [Halteromyces radiatus]|uniref:Frag1/DRAM/Sfk1 n=1 Tax=Halteromyces radiatus TaxID=101107 RepID=UPI00221F1356|nr:Frag1/DRAM/Sfk1 [Halteromyces radiatus]KAI8081582.1 Frag1/DRAM/Sfk1 [Halteromyces radiatus]